MPARARKLFSSFGHAFDAFATSVGTARLLNELSNTPESVFEARGTTRDAAIRAAVKRL